MMNCVVDARMQAAAVRVVTVAELREETIAGARAAVVRAEGELSAWSVRSEW